MGDIGRSVQAGAGIASAGIQAGAITSAAGKQADAAKYAADQQFRAAQSANQLQQTEFNKQQQNIAPYLQAGRTGLNQLTQGTKPGGSLVRGYGEQFNQPSQFNVGAFNENGQQNQNTHFSFSGVDAQNDPGYQFRLQQGQQALDRSEAAQGVTGGAALKAAAQYGQNFASNEYQNAFNRAQSVFQQNFADTAEQGQQNFANALTGYQTNFNDQSQAFANNYNRGQNEFETNYDVSANNQANAFNRLAALSGIGQTANSQLGAAGANYANQSGANLLNAANSGANYLTQGANASAAGNIGLGNVFGSLTNQLAGIYGPEPGQSRPRGNSLGGIYDSSGAYIGE